MKDEYDFSTMRSRPNPYAAQLQHQITLNVGNDVIAYFKQMSDETEIPYQTLITLYLRDCMTQNRKIAWQ